MAISFSANTVTGLVADADLSSSQFRFVKIQDSPPDDLKIILCDTLGEHSIGVLQDKPVIGESVTVLTEGSISKVVAGGAIGANDLIATDATGAAVTAGAGHRILGTAKNSAAGAGELIEVVLDGAGTI